MGQRRSPLKQALLVYAPLVLMALFIVLRLTVGEANPVVYGLMALPAPGWPILFGIIGLVWLIRKRRVFAGLYLGFAIAIVFPLLNPSCGSPRGGTTPTLRVMSFNVQKFHNFGPAAVVAAIRKEKPDIVCLQEANQWDPGKPLPEEFRQAIPEYQVVQRGQTAILSKYPVGFGAVFALRSGTDGRPAQMLSVMVQGRPVSVICVHLQYFPWDKSISVAQASRNLMKETQSLEDLVKEPGVPTIVAGDFNTLPHGRIHRMMRRYLTDCFAATARGFGLTLPAVFPLKRLDYIYVGQGLSPVKCWVSEEVASDHRAVVADLVLE